MTRQRWWLLALAGAVAALYGLATSGATELVLDDRPILHDNPVVRDARLGEALIRPWWPDVGRMASPPPNWRPLTTLTFALQALWQDADAPAGFRPGPFQAVNVALYVAVVGCVWALARRLLPDGPGAGLAALAFAFHPAHVEAVVPIVGRADLLAALGVLGGLEAWLRWREGGRPAWLVAATAAYAFGLAGKESAALLLLVLPAADWLVRGEPLRTLVGPRGRGLVRYAPFVVVAGLYVVARVAVLGGSTWQQPHLVADDPLTRALSVARNTAVSLRLLLAPLETHHILTTLPEQARHSWPTPTLGRAAAVNVPVAFAALAGWLALRRRAPRAAFCWLAAIATWLPTSGLLPIGAGVALRFLFLPSAFAALGLGLGVAAGLRRAGTAAPTVACAFGAVVVLLGAGLTAAHAPRWWSSQRLFASVIRQEPRCPRALAALGAALANAGRHVEARETLRRTLAMDPDWREARFNLLMQDLHDAEGRPLGRGADLWPARIGVAGLLARDPHPWDAWAALSNIEDADGRRDARVAALTRSLAGDPPPAEAERMRNALRGLGAAVPGDGS